MGSCLGCCYSCFCCECNMLIFPAPSPPSYNSTLPNLKQFTNSHNQQIPYLHIAHKSPKHNLIFFHGNAQDVGYSQNFLLPIGQHLQASIFVLEYPTYGTYSLTIPARISNRIKSDAVDFFHYLLHKEDVVRERVVVVGRSIGSGGACFLAANQKLPNLILISPFSTIPKVATDIVGCLGNIVKCHFDNMEQIQQFQGRLLLIHGRMDQVIHCRHGEMLANLYIRKNPKNCTVLYPNNMSHNHFNYENDILAPIVSFMKCYNLNIN